MESNTSFGKIILVNSLIAAAILFVIGILYYLLDVNYFSIGFSIINLIIMLTVIIVFSVIGTRSYRDKLLEGKINYGKKFLAILLISLIAMVVSSLANTFLFELIDPDHMLRQSEEFLMQMEERGLSDAQLDQIEERISGQQTLSGRLKQTFMFIPIMSVILSLIVAATIKSDTTIPKESV